MKYLLEISSNQAKLKPGYLRGCILWKNFKKTENRFKISVSEKPYSGRLKSYIKLKNNLKNGL